MKIVKYNWFRETNLFYLVLIADLFLISTIKFYPSTDGPAHLYNSNIIYHLITRDSALLNDFFVLNDFPIPNWLSHFILSLLNWFLPAFIAEKGLLFFHIIALSISFRLLVKQLHDGGTYLSFFIFPFAYSFLFHTGFYNYSMSFIFLFFTLYYWLKTKNETGIKKQLVLFVLITLCYFSSILTYIFTEICLGLFLLVENFAEYRETKNLKSVAVNLLKSSAWLILISLPSLILLFLFYNQIVFYPSCHEYSFGELLIWIKDTRPLIAYNYVTEKYLTAILFYLIVAIGLISIFLRIRNKSFQKWFYKFQYADIILIPAALSLVLLFITPDGSNAGMMSDRYCLLFFMLMIIWVASQTIPALIRFIAVLLILIVHFSLLLTHLNATQKSLNKDAKVIYETAGKINANSIVLPIDLTGNWLESHFSNYLGIDKPLVILENYEADVKWFPVRWNTEKIPELMLGSKIWKGGANRINNLSKASQIDYVFIYGNSLKIDEKNMAVLKNQLDSSYQLNYVSEDKFVRLYAKKTQSKH